MKNQLPWINHAAGTSGNMVYQTYNGHTYSHAKTTLYHYPNTPAQQDTQGKYYNIMWQFLPIYRHLKKFIPKQVRHNCNMYDVLSHGVFLASLTFPNPLRKTPPKWFGHDTMRQIDLHFSDINSAIDEEWIRLNFNVLQTSFRRRFKPAFSHILLVNITQQMLIAQTDEYQSSTFAIRLQNVSKWQPSDTIAAYLALSDNTFFTNFYRIEL